MEFMESIWPLHYRPSVLEDYLCTDPFKKVIEGWISGKVRSHLFFESSYPGTGKTTLALIIAKSTTDDYEIFNASEDNGIATVRDRITKYCLATSLTSKTKVVVLDEIDNMSMEAVKALRGIVDKFNNHVRFIATCNRFSQIPEEIREAFKDRCHKIDFMNLPGSTNKSEINKLKSKTLKKCIGILEDNNVPYDKKFVKEIIQNNFINGSVRFRRIIQTLYENQINGIFEDYVSKTDIDLDDLVKIIKSQDEESLRIWAQTHSYMSQDIVDELFDNMSDYIDKNHPKYGLHWVLLNECQGNLNNYPNKAIVLSSTLYEMMCIGAFK